MILDSSVLVDIDRGGVDAKVKRLDDRGRHAISMVSVTELRLGVELQYDDEESRRQARSEIDRLLARFEILPVSRPVAAAAAEIITQLTERGEGLHDLHDVYIAATGRVRQLPVLTANVDHFERIEGLDVVDWGEF